MLNENIIFSIFSLLLIISAFMVIVSKHPIFTLLFLVSSFLSASFLLFILECEFLALIFIIIYEKAIAILFLFAIIILEVNVDIPVLHSYFALNLLVVDLILLLVLVGVTYLMNEYKRQFKNQITFKQLARKYMGEAINKSAN